MLRVELDGSQRYCDGWSRRSFLQIGVAGMANVGLLARRAGWWPPGRRAIPSPNAPAQPLGSGTHQRP